MAAFYRIILFVISIYVILSVNASPFEAAVQVRQQPQQAVISLHRSNDAFSDVMATSETIDSTPVR